MEEARAHLFIDGRVQGVLYRAYTRDIAASLGLNGWVRNLKDGRVEALFEGDKKLIEQAIKECYRGPHWARVTHIDATWEPHTGEEKGFSIRY